MTQFRQEENMENQLEDLLAWLFVKTEEEILAEAEVAALKSMFFAEDPRPEGARQ
jgi:hypothetical protein